MTTTIELPQAPAAVRSPPGAAPPLPRIAVLMRPNPALEQALAQRYRVDYLPPGAPLISLPPGALAEIRAIVTVGGRGLNPFGLDDFPALELIAVSGAGYDQVDLEATRRRGIATSYGKDSNAACVADHALALLLAAARAIVPAAAATSALGLPLRQISGKRAGIIGLGHIGGAIARRLAGFDIDVSYHGRKQQDGVPYRYVADPVALAREVDFLFVACPGGAATRHLVGADVLRALGPNGILVNISRGSVVDTAALLAALHGAALAGAALDVIEGEPVVDAAVRTIPNLLLTPHIASQSPETMAAVLALLQANLDAHFAGRPLPTPIPAP